MQASIVGQETVVERLIIGLLANGNLLVEGLPGLAKTRAIKALARNIEADFSRIQFTPDLLPSDVTGTEVYYQADGGGSFRFEPGPIFANIVLGDEINRAPAKVQAAMLEAMEERQVTVAGTTHRMPRLFMVMATQNPVEQEGTYPLPEAQLDRFLMHVNIGYPPVEDEVAIVDLVRREEAEAQRASDAAAATEGRAADGAADPAGRIPQQAVFDARREIAAIRVPDAIKRYVADLVYATRTPARFSEDLAKWIDVGGSPRASIALDRCSRVHAWLQARDYVDPEDVRAVVHDCLRHRLGLSYAAEGEGVLADQVIDEVIARVALP
ncbi:AAA family ATPase [Pseudohaliea sp.]|uniref:AAA family ATPase n=1 Tax=Pseudohaliea sp. TaxID=2740289 RepID=UPI0032EEC97C